MGFCDAKTLSGAFDAEDVWESCWQGGGSSPSTFIPHTPPRVYPPPTPFQFVSARVQYVRLMPRTSVRYPAEEEEGPVSHANPWVRGLPAAPTPVPPTVALGTRTAQYPPPPPHVLRPQCSVGRDAKNKQKIGGARSFFLR